ncbi:MAG: hypothetical protein HY744_01130 [Deltaproteobacteria bacterium]|nr:hypothetical protein [Deltaproteobacteria bacterium]
MAVLIRSVRGLLLLTCAAAGCELAVDGELGQVRCTEPEAYGPPACPEGQTCRWGVCLPLGAPLGYACSTDADCAPAAVCLGGLGSGAAEAPRCTRSCCASSDCGPPGAGHVCWAAPEGAGRFCRPAAELGRSAPGSAPARAKCDDGAQCRSGRCIKGRCFDLCCDDSYCAGEDKTVRCRAEHDAETDATSFVCGPAAGKGEPLASCEDGGGCASGLCVELKEGLRVCAAPCCSSRQCGQVPVGEKLQAVACAAGEAVREPACARLLPEGARGSVGAPCQADKECRSGICVKDPGSGSYCGDVCCRDADCGDTARFACRPASRGASWFLQCVRK